MAELIRVLPGRRNSREKQQPEGLASGNSRGAETGRPRVCLEGCPSLKAGVRSRPSLFGQEAVRFAVWQTGWMGWIVGGVGGRGHVTFMPPPPLISVFARFPQALLAAGLRRPNAPVESRRHKPAQPSLSVRAYSPTIHSLPSVPRRRALSACPRVGIEPRVARSVPRVGQ